MRIWRCRSRREFLFASVVINALGWFVLFIRYFAHAKNANKPQHTTKCRCGAETGGDDGLWLLLGGGGSVFHSRKDSRVDLHTTVYARFSPRSEFFFLRQQRVPPPPHHHSITFPSCSEFFEQQSFIPLPARGGVHRFASFAVPPTFPLPPHLVLARIIQHVVVLLPFVYSVSLWQIIFRTEIFFARFTCAKHPSSFPPSDFEFSFSGDFVGAKNTPALPHSYLIRIGSRTFLSEKKFQWRIWRGAIGAIAPLLTTSFFV